MRGDRAKGHEIALEISPGERVGVPRVCEVSHAPQVRRESDGQQLQGFPLV